MVTVTIIIITTSSIITIELTTSMMMMIIIINIIIMLIISTPLIIRGWTGDVDAAAPVRPLGRGRGGAGERSRFIKGGCSGNRV